MVGSSSGESTSAPADAPHAENAIHRSEPAAKNKEGHMKAVDKLRQGAREAKKKESK
jgi:hypothetical protein